MKKRCLDRKHQESIFPPRQQWHRICPSNYFVLESVEGSSLPEVIQGTFQSISALMNSSYPSSTPTSRVGNCVFPEQHMRGEKKDPVL